MSDSPIYSSDSYNSSSESGWRLICMINFRIISACDTYYNVTRYWNYHSNNTINYEFWNPDDNTTSYYRVFYGYNTDSSPNNSYDIHCKLNPFFSHFLCS